MTAKVNNSTPPLDRAADVLREMGIMDFAPPPLQKRDSDATAHASNKNPQSVLASLAEVADRAHPPAQERKPLFEISDNLRPVTPDEQAERAEFLVSMFVHASNELVHSLIRRKGKSEIGSSVSEAEVDSAIKSLATISTYIAGLEHGGAEGPEWFVDFIFQTLRGIDSLKPFPAARSIVESFGSFREEVMRHQVSASISEMLGMSEEGCVAEVDAFLAQSRMYRNELFMFALGQSREVVRQHTIMLNMLAVA